MTIKKIDVVRRGHVWKVTALIEKEQHYLLAPIEGGANFALLMFDEEKYCLNLRTGTIELATHPTQYVETDSAPA